MERRRTAGAGGAIIPGSDLYIHRWIGRVRAWWSNRAAIRQLGADDPARRMAAIEMLVNRGRFSTSMLIRALQGSPILACSAAEALERLGMEVGIQTVLVRCYDEEWLSEHPSRSSILTALRRVPQHRIGSALQAGLAGAATERDLGRCFDRLTLSLSALRLLLGYGSPSPMDWWEQGLNFGHTSLPRIRSHPFVGLAYSLTDRIRAAALRGMLVQYPSSAFGECARGLQSNELAVMRTAIAGLSRLRDNRALALLQPIAFSAHHPLLIEARKAIESIAGPEAESLILMRSSYADANSPVTVDLVRPADIYQHESAAELLRSING